MLVERRDVDTGPKPLASAGSPDGDSLGARIRTARQSRGISLRELARRINVSASFVSQVERGRAQPSVATLYAMVAELGASLDSVMTGASNAPTTEGSVVSPAHNGLDKKDPPPWDAYQSEWPRVEFPLQTRDGRKQIRLTGVLWERLTVEDDPYIDFLDVFYEPHSSSCQKDDMMRHGGREYGRLITGCLHVQVGFETYVMEPGDAIHFDSMTPHRLSNPYDEPAHAVWVVLGRKDDMRIVEPASPKSNHLPGLM